MARKGLTHAVAYLRTSSMANVGTDKDSDKRQREAIQGFAKRSGYVVTDEFYDAAVSGADPIETRPGFAALLDRIEGNGVRTVLVEDASRFARDLVTQELGIIALAARDVRVITASGDDLTNTDDPFKVAMRQIAGAFAQLEKARLVAKLKSGRERANRHAGRKLDVRKSLAELYPEAVARAKYLRRYRKQSLREIAATLASEGHTTRNKGTPFNAKVIKTMIES